MQAIHWFLVSTSMNMRGVKRKRICSNNTLPLQVRCKPRRSASCSVRCIRVFGGRTGRTRPKTRRYAVGTLGMETDRRLVSFWLRCENVVGCDKIESSLNLFISLQDVQTVCRKKIDCVMVVVNRSLHLELSSCQANRWYEYGETQTRQMLQARNEW